MLKEILASELGGVIKAVPAKAYAHRLLICAALSDAPTVIRGLFDSEDILATIGALRACGVGLEYDGGVCTVTPPDRFATRATLDCRESGSTLRFLLPVAAALGINATFVGRGQLPKRPIGELLKVLSAHGVKADSSRLPVTLNGVLEGDVFDVDGSASSQFVTGLLLALSALGGKKRLVCSGERVSESYIKITSDVLKQFGYSVTEDAEGFSLEKVCSGVRDVTVEGDWSNAAFWLVAGAIGRQPITVTGLNPDSVQGDKAILRYLREMGAGVFVSDGSVTVKPSVLTAIDADCRDCPDLIPILSVAAACARGTSIFRGAERLRIKECDRLEAMLNILRAAKIECSYSDNALSVRGGSPQYFNAVCHSDHRIIMSAAVLGQSCGCTIDDAAGVKKSYPAFFDDYQSLGGKYAITL